MNVPSIDTRATENGYANWFEHLEDGIVSISSATFVSLLIPCKAIRAVGYPIADYFIWGDDTEYTTRITTNYATAYFVGKSKVLQELYNFMCKDEQLLKLNSNWV
jgi:GT2 family glycosyltransferase